MARGAPSSTARHGAPARQMVAWVWNTETRTLGGELDAGATLGVADGPVGQPERQVVHRPARRYADRPEPDAARVVLDGGLGSSGQHLDDPGLRPDPIEHSGRQCAGREALIRGDGSQQVDIGGDPFNAQLIERSAKSDDGIVPAISSNHDLGQQRIVVSAHGRPGLDPRVDPGVARKVDGGQPARARRVVPPGVLGTDPRLDGMAPGHDRMVEDGAIAGGQTNHPLHQVDPVDRFCDRVLDLEAGIDLEEGHRFGRHVDEELDGSRRAVRGQRRQPVAPPRSGRCASTREVPVRAIPRGPSGAAAEPNSPDRRG